MTQGVRGSNTRVGVMVLDEELGVNGGGGWVRSAVGSF